MSETSCMMQRDSDSFITVLILAEKREMYRDAVHPQFLKGSKNTFSHMHCAIKHLQSTTICYTGVDATVLKYSQGCLLAQREHWVKRWRRERERETMHLHNMPAAVWDEGAGLDTRLNSQYQQPVLLPLQCMVSLAVFISALLSICLPLCSLTQPWNSYTFTSIYYSVGD